MSSNDGYSTRKPRHQRGVTESKTYAKSNSSRQPVDDTVEASVTQYPNYQPAAAAIRQTSTGWDPRCKDVHRILGACSTDHPSYQAVVSNKPRSHTHYSNGSQYDRSLSRTDNSYSSQDTHWSTEKYYQPLSENLRSKRLHSNDHLNSNFAQLLPVSSQFPDPDILPESMQNMSRSEQVVNFYPVHEKGTKYLKYCTGWLSDDEKPRHTRDIIWKYTSGRNWYCTEVNMALALDSRKLSSYGPYIKQLKYSIGMSPMGFTGTVFRG